ncbi:MAG: mechanosensitive ion channel family protein [Acidobacteriota bacterium]|jgi:MscS family membrane protein
MSLRRGVLFVLVVAACTAQVVSAAGGGDVLGVAEREAINPGLPAPPAGVVRATAAGAWQSLQELCAERRYVPASHLLDLTEIRVADQLELGRELVEKLCRILSARGVERVPVSALGPLSGADGEGGNAVVVAHFQRGGLAGEVWLRRTRDLSSGEVAWLVTRRSVSSIPLWYSVVVEGKSVQQQGPLNEGLGEPPAGLKRGSPREAVTGFLALARRGEFATAAHFLDLSEIPPDQQVRVGQLSARRLMLMLVRQGWVRSSQLSNDPAGAPEQGVADDRELLATVPVRGREVEVSLQRRVDPELGMIWTFSADTVAEIPALYRSYGYSLVGDHLPVVFFAVTFAGLQLWQWCALALIIVVGWLVGRAAGHWCVAILRAFARRTEAQWDDVAIHTLDGPLGIVLWGSWLSLAAPWVGLDTASFRVTHTLFRLLVLVGLAWLLFRTVDAITAQMRRAAGEANSLALGFIPILTKVLKTLVVVLAVLAALDTVGVNVMALVAGLGLGGLAIAFAAQKTIENLFGAVAIAGDRPFKVGDFISIGDISGTVEDVGLRSTRLRTMQRTLVTIPNGAVANERVTNLTARDRMLYNPILGVVYGTTADQLVFIIDETRKLLLTHPRVFQGAQRVRFKGFGAYSLDIEVMAWVMTQDFVEFTAIAEELNLAIMRIVEASGSSFAFPSQTVYLGRDGGLDAQRAEEIARTVAERREAGELAVPEPSPELRAALQGKNSANGEGI